MDEQKEKAYDSLKNSKHYIESNCWKDDYTKARRYIIHIPKGKVSCIHSERTY